MEQLIPDLETVYGIKPRSIIKSKYFYIISANGRNYRLYPLSGEAEESESLVLINEKLYDAGAPVCPVVKTQDGEGTSVFEEERYMLALTPRGRMPDIQNPADMLETAAALGYFHRLLRGFDTGGGEIAAPYTKGLAALKNIKSIINRKNKQNETDKLFLQNYSAVYSLAQNAADTLSNCGLCTTYAYGAPKEENFIINAQKAVITNWNSLNISHFLEDTAYFFKRYLKKAEPPRLTKDELLAAYTGQNPLTAAEEDALSCIMRYPAKYIAVFKEYYGKHRPFAPLYVREKIEKELASLGL
ncbi:MAG: hypothetical protein IJR59_05060 [Firmicutes bacterium]|nr:hypothetical protein [Bacillota bacterium]